MSSVKKKLFNMVKTTVGSTTTAELNHVESVNKDSAILMANAKKRWLIDYQQEREKKSEYVKQNVIAQNLDVGKL